MLVVGLASNIQLNSNTNVYNLFLVYAFLIVITVVFFTITVLVFEDCTRTILKNTINSSFSLNHPGEYLYG